jgi:hypothetical protein
VAEQTQGTTSRAGSIPITVIQAVGVRVYGRVVGPLHPALALSNLSLTVNRSAAGQFGGAVDAGVKFSVRNAGNTVLSPATGVVLTTPFGTAARRTLPMSELLPGSSQAYSMTFSGLSAYGHLRAEVRATSGRAEASAATTAWVVPWALFIVILGALIMIVIVIRARRHKRIVAPPPPGPETP